jgi:hypothetical protein
VIASPVSSQVLEFGQVGLYFTGWPLDRDRVGRPHRSHPLLATGTAWSHWRITAKSATAS